MNHLSNIFRMLKTAKIMVVVGIVKSITYNCLLCVFFSLLTVTDSWAISCTLLRGDGYNKKDNDVLSVGNNHYFCDDDDSCDGYVVGVAGYASIVKKTGPNATGSEWGGNGYWVKCDIRTLKDLWVADKQITKCNVDKILEHEQKNKLVTSYKVYTDITPVIIKAPSIIQSSVAVKTNQTLGWCLAYQCKGAEVADANHTYCITPLVEETTTAEQSVPLNGSVAQTPAEQPVVVNSPVNPMLSDAATRDLALELVDADPCDTETGCVPTCVAGAETVDFSGGKCHAITCANNFYLVKNDAGVSMGWCYGKTCPTGQHVQTDERNMVLPPDVQCVEDEIATPSTVEAPVTTTESAEQDVPVTESAIADASIETTEEPDETGNNPTPGPSVDAEESITEPVAPSGRADGESCEKPGAVSAEYRGGKCVAMKCSPGFELDGDDCIEISGPCDALPENATRGHRQYNADTDSVQCIVDDCVDGYVVADDKLSCHEDYDALAKQAREREQSTGNKLLGAVGMGATGVGGAMLMSGLAESASDDEAERAMKAYLSTFTCKYGNESVSGGTMNVEIPGGNELIQMYAEYVALANDLKVRKEALGMKPGIESEAILDSATSGLYDDVSTGKTQGAYASLARALSDPNSEDAKIWATQREESDEKKKTGAITAGAGAGASLVGNIISEGVDKNKNK